MIFIYKIIPVFFLFIIPLSLPAKSRPYEIDGKMSCIADSIKVYMAYENNEGEYGIDSCNVKDGKFSFQGSAEYPFFARITVDHDGKSFGQPNADVLKLYIDTGIIKIHGYKNIASARVTGSPSTDLLIEYNKKQQTYQRETELLEHTFRNAIPEQRISR